MKREGLWASEVGSNSSYLMDVCSSHLTEVQRRIRRSCFETHVDIRSTYYRRILHGHGSTTPLRSNFSIPIWIPKE